MRCTWRGCVLSKRGECCCDGMQVSVGDGIRSNACSAACFVMIVGDETTRLKNPPSSC